MCSAAEHIGPVMTEISAGVVNSLWETVAISGSRKALLVQSRSLVDDFDDFYSHSRVVFRV